MHTLALGQAIELKLPTNDSADVVTVDVDELIVVRLTALLLDELAVVKPTEVNEFDLFEKF